MNKSDNTQNNTKKPAELIKAIKLPGAIALVVGSSIGSGIFIAPSIMAQKIASPSIIILLWILGGLITATGAVTCAELAAAMPRSGGQYAYMKEAYSPLWGFLYGWTLLLVIQTGLIAAVAVAFAKYLGALIPGISENNILLNFSLGNLPFQFNTAQLVGIISIILLTGINCLGVKSGDTIQKIFTLLKVAAVLTLAVLGFTLSKGSTANFTAAPNIFPEAAQIGILGSLAWALSKALFSYDAWNTVTFASGEIEKPEENLPKALIWGTIIITFVYVAVTAVYFYIIPIGQAALIPDNRIAAQAAQFIFGGAGVAFIAASIMISTFGCNNGLILGGARVFYAMAKDNLFFKKFKEIHPRYRTPIYALVLQGLWAIILTMTGTYSDLLTYITFASILFNVMMVAAVFILRKKMPHLPRPYKTFGYPVVPIVSLTLSTAFLIFIIQSDISQILSSLAAQPYTTTELIKAILASNTLRGLALILLGLPVYHIAFKPTTAITPQPTPEPTPE